MRASHNEETLRMLATATWKLKSFAPRLGSALRETRDRLIPGNLLLRQLIAAEAQDTRWQATLPQVAENDSNRLLAMETTARRDILAAQRLRYRVFTEEYGARFDGIQGIDADRYDKHCRHIVVKDTLSGQVVGYTRLLTSDRARRAGGWYSAGEFQLGMVEKLQGRVMEIGRTCVHPAYRNGGVIAVLWSKLAEILLSEGHDWLFGCASIALGDDNAPALLAEMAAREETDARFRVEPLQALPFALPGRAPRAGKLPPLLRTYISMGARVCGPACWDPDFHCADVFVLVEVAAIPERYKRHFMSARTEARATGLVA